MGQARTRHRLREDHAGPRRNDYEVWQRHKEIGAINILNPDGTLNDSVPDKYRGLKMHTKARDAVVADLDRTGFAQS